MYWINREENKYCILTGEQVWPEICHFIQGGREGNLVGDVFFVEFEEEEGLNRCLRERDKERTDNRDIAEMTRLFISSHRYFVILFGHLSSLLFGPIRSPLPLVRHSPSISDPRERGRDRDGAGVGEQSIWICPWCEGDPHHFYGCSAAMTVHRFLDHIAFTRREAFCPSLPLPSPPYKNRK